MKTLPDGNELVKHIGATLLTMSLHHNIQNSQRIARLPGIIVLGACLLDSPVTKAQLAPQGRAEAPIIKYRTREEKREAGLSTAFTPWLSFQGVVESEVLHETTGFAEDITDHHADYVDPAVQLNFEIRFWENFEAELIFEYTEDTTDPVMEELILGWDIGDFGISAGRYYIQFGEYFSNFINGPLLEFSQTRGDVIQVDYDFEDRFEIAAFVFDSRSEKASGSSVSDNWGVSFEAKFLEDHIILGGGWLSNIADGDFHPLEEVNDIYANSVPAWNLYLIAEWENAGFSLEQVKATRAFQELDPEEDEPWAWNAEAAWYPTRSTEFALRFEQAGEIVDEAEKQSGIQFTWRPANRFSFSVEYIRQSYKRDFVFDDEDREIRSGELIAASMNFIF